MEKFVCSLCFGNKHISKFIKLTGDRGKCSFCENSNSFPRRANVVTLETIYSYLRECLSLEYDEPHPDFIPYDRETHDFIVQPDLLSDVLDKEGADCQHAELESQLNKLAGCELLVNINSVVPTSAEYQSDQWEFFCEKINSGQLDLELFGTLRDIVAYALEIIPIRKIDASIKFFRARKCDPRNPFEKNAKNLGTSTHKFSSTRFLPPGQNAFYSAFDAKTAIAELQLKDSEVAVIGEWIANRSIRLIDFSQLIKSISIFDNLHNHRRDQVSFLNSFRKAITEPASGNRETAYVSTQFLFKELIFAFRNHRKIDGMIYQSAIVPDSKCSVIFVSNSACVDRKIKHATLHMQLISTEI